MKINSLTDMYERDAKPVTVASYHKKADEKITPRADALEISKEGKKLYNDKELYATSGKDILGISKKKGENSYIVSFEHSAFVERAVARGYITVNGKTIKLSEADKKRLLKADKEAQKMREAAFEKRHAEHNMRVAKQQGAVYELAAREEIELLKLQIRLSKGEKLTPAELKKLIEKDPQGYQMAMMIRNMKPKKKAEEKVKTATKEEEKYLEELEKTATTEVLDKDIEWKYYDTTLSVSFEGDEAVVGEAGMEERYIVKPE